MAKLSQLSGIAHNLVDSFVSPSNMLFLQYIESLPEEKTKLIEIDLLYETVVPEEITSFTMKQTISGYKNWFVSELEKTKIKREDIERVVVKIAYKPGKSFGKYYTCNTTIKAKGKEYTGKIFSSYS